MKGSIKFTKSVFDHVKHQIKQDVMKSPESMPHLRKEIARVFQQANRRIQNVENSGLFSPAVASLNKGDIKNYSKFSLGGKSWTELKIEYSKAVSFLRQPTSSSTGARQYNEHIRKAYDLTKDEYRLMTDKIQGKLMSLSDSDFVERYLMRYKDFSGELEQTARSLSAQMESDAEQLSTALQHEIDETAIDSLGDPNTQDNIGKLVDYLDKKGYFKGEL